MTTRWFALICAVILALVTFGEFYREQHNPTIILKLNEWTCTDVEPDGCAEYRRQHNHPLPSSAYR